MTRETDEKRPILLTGGGGQVGSELRARADLGPRLHAPTRAQLDIADPEAIAAYVAARPFAAVINAGAYTAVDKAQTDVVAAWKANALGPAALAQATALAGIPLVHVSTDYVFDGAKPGPYVEDDAVAPLGVYGASKEAGEQAVRTANARHVILRTAWVVSAHGGNFLKTMLRLAAERPVLTVVDDQIGCPTTAASIAEALAVITLRQIADCAAPAGTYHFVNQGEATWCGFAREIVTQAARRGHPAPEVQAITTAQFPTPAKRPANSRLSTAKLTRDYGLVPRAWRDAIDDVIADLLPQTEGIAR